MPSTATPLPRLGPTRTVTYTPAKLCPHCGGELKPATTLPQYITVPWRLEEYQIRKANETPTSVDTTTWREP